MTIYTAIFGNYEELKEPLIYTPGWKYVCYTDQPFKSKIWHIIKKHQFDTGPQRTARFYKLLEYPEENSIWVDGSFIINCNLTDFWSNHYKPFFACPMHPIRDCVYTEASICITNKRANANDLIAQFAKYKQEKMPRHNGLITSGLLLRQKCKEVDDFCKFWHDELSGQSTRDQIAFAYAAWKTGFKPSTFKWDYRSAKEFIFKTHYHRR